MMPFLVLGCSMLLLGLVFVLPPLLRREASPRSDLQLPDPAQPRVALALAVALPLLAATVYGLVGHPASLAPEAAVASLAELETQAARRPGDLEGLRALARAYESAQRFDDAVGIHRRLLALRPDDADLLVEAAVTLGMTQQAQLAGEPEALIQRALVLAPGHVQALALAGSARFERRDFEGALASWQQLLDRVPADSPVAESILRSMAKATSMARGGAASAPR